MPEVSIIIPTLDRPELLAQALGSVVNQTYNDFEVIIIDESKDAARRRNAKLTQCDPRVRHIHRKRRSSLSRARNAGIRLARGEYIAFLDDDDLWLPQKLEKQVKFMSSNKGVAAVWCDCRFTGIAEGGAELGDSANRRDLPRWTSHPPPAINGRISSLVRHRTLYESLLYKWVIKISTFLASRSALESVGLFDENLPTIEDQDLFRRLALRNTLAHLGEVLVHKRWHSLSLSNNAELMCAGWARELSKIRTELPACYENQFPAVARHIYVQMIHLSLRQGEFAVAEPLIRTFAREFGVVRLLMFLSKLAAAGELTTLGFFQRSANEDARRMAFSLATRASLNILLNYSEFVASQNQTILERVG